MADAWTTLLEHSTLGSGDAWEHLNAQEGGGSGGPIIYYGARNGLHFSMVPSKLSFSTKPHNKKFVFKENKLSFCLSRKTLSIKSKSSGYTFKLKRVIF